MTTNAYTLTLISIASLSGLLVMLAARTPRGKVKGANP